MLELANQAAAFAMVLGSFFAGPLIALAFVNFRKRRARARRRSPMNITLLRLPGHTLREQLDEATSTVGSYVTMVMFIPVVMLAFFLAQGQFLGTQRAGHPATIYLVMSLGFIAVMVFKLWKAGEQLDRLKAGLDAELAVGQKLDQLMRHGAVVFHDVPAEGFNIDHVVVAKKGVFAVETKGFTKLVRGSARANSIVVFDGQTLRFPTHTTAEPLEQASRQSAWLGRWLTSAIGTAVRAQPVLALPGWYIERTGQGAVRVYSGPELETLLDGAGPQALSDQEVQRIAHQLDQRCRTVKLLYSLEA